MCGICAIFGSPLESTPLLEKCLEASKLIRHRGPDWSGSHIYKDVNGHGGYNALAHERLSLVGVRSGTQPLYNNDKTVCASVNGEIYNHMELRMLIPKEFVDAFASDSDCQVIPYLYRICGPAFVNKLDGMFAFVIADETSGKFMAARDPIGICPLYIGYHIDGSTWFASEMKSLVKDCSRVEIFPPGCMYTSDNGSFDRYFNPIWWSLEGRIPSNKLALDEIRITLERSVEKRLMCDVPFGVLLSGGVDSSLVAAIACRTHSRIAHKCSQWFKDIHSFSIGLEGSPDLKAAKVVAEALGCRHFEFTFNVDDGLKALRDVIWHLETYDITTIRAATPLYFISRLVKSLGIKMALSGEGADEIFGGYLYFHKAPNKEEFHRETQRKIRALHQFDVLRANKAAMAFGLELRFPFLDKDFLELCMNIDPGEKTCLPGKRIEKWALRAAFDNGEYIPREVLWRQKEQFSDGVGYAWIDGIKEYARTAITDTQMSRAALLFPFNAPLTKEGYLYRCIFNTLFPLSSAAETVVGGPSIACSTSAAIEWDKMFKDNADQSGRSVIGVHTDATKFNDLKVQ